MVRQGASASGQLRQGKKLATHVNPAAAAVIRSCEPQNHLLQTKVVLPDWNNQDGTRGKCSAVPAGRHG